jgi:hypothetical protein
VIIPKLVAEGLQRIGKVALLITTSILKLITPCNTGLPEALFSQDMSSFSTQKLLLGLVF